MSKVLERFMKELAKDKDEKPKWLTGLNEKTGELVSINTETGETIAILKREKR